MAAFTAARPGEVVIEPHREVDDGRGQQEVYVMIRGAARFVIDGTEALHCGRIDSEVLEREQRLACWDADHGEEQMSRFSECVGSVAAYLAGSSTTSTARGVNGRRWGFAALPTPNARSNACWPRGRPLSSRGREARRKEQSSARPVTFRRSDPSSWRDGFLSERDGAKPNQERILRIVIFGANGPTGRLLTECCLSAGHDTAVVTRHPDSFPLADTHLRVIGAYVLDPDAADAVVEGNDAVLSCLGVPFGNAPVDVYSRGVQHMLEAMARHDVRRLVVVSSGAVTGEDEPTGGVLFNRVLQPYVMKKLGKTVYDDMRRMEELVIGSEVDWTILRPSGFYELSSVSDYSLTEARGPGRFTARIDLADAMLRQVGDDRFVRKIGHVITTESNPSLFSMMLREAFKK